MAAIEDGARNCGNSSAPPTREPRSGARLKAPDAGDGALTSSMAPETTDPIAAYGWGRRVIAWSLRRARRLARRGHAPHALRIIRRLAAVAPKLPSVQFCLARLASELGDLETARRAGDSVLAVVSAKTRRFHCRFAAHYLRHGDFGGAEACLKAAKLAFPTSAPVWVLAGELNRHRGNAEQAVGSFERALTLAMEPDERLRALAGLAMCCADTGRLDDAMSVGQRMIELSPNATLGYELLVNSRVGGALPDDVTQSMVRLLGNKSLSRPDRMRLHYALGKVCDGRGDYGEAFAHFTLANGIRGQLSGRFSTELTKERLQATTEVFDTRFISAMSDHGCDDDFLICIVGFPRSGTTLIEQVLSSHPGVSALGERTDFRRAAESLQFRLKSRHRYPKCCAKLAPREVSELAGQVREKLLAGVPEGTRVVTKHPGDCWEVGLIRIYL